MNFDVYYDKYYKWDVRREMRYDICTFDASIDNERGVVGINKLMIEHVVMNSADVSLQMVEMVELNRIYCHVSPE